MEIQKISCLIQKYIPLLFPVLFYSVFLPSISILTLSKFIYIYIYWCYNIEVLIWYNFIFKIIRLFFFISLLCTSVGIGCTVSNFHKKKQGKGINLVLCLFLSQEQESAFYNSLYSMFYTCEYVCLSLLFILWYFLFYVILTLVERKWKKKTRKKRELKSIKK